MSRIITNKKKDDIYNGDSSLEQDPFSQIIWQHRIPTIRYFGL